MLEKPRRRCSSAVKNRKPLRAKKPRMAAKKKIASRAPARRMPRKQKPQSAGLDPSSCSVDAPDAALRALEEIVASEGGVVVGRYRDPLGGHPTLVTVLPV